jgi:hypothetical protein
VKGLFDHPDRVGGLRRGGRSFFSLSSCCILDELKEMIMQAVFNRNCIFAAVRRGAGVADRGSLENCCTLRGTEGSNPSLSAKICISRGAARDLHKKKDSSSLEVLFFMQRPPARSDGREMQIFAGIPFRGSRALASNPISRNHISRSAAASKLFFAQRRGDFIPLSTLHKTKSKIYIDADGVNSYFYFATIKSIHYLHT